MNFSLRPYQESAINAARESLRTNRATILKLATGCGKTIIAAGIIKSAVTKGRRVLMFAHTTELVEQAGDKVSRATGVQYGVEKAQSRAHDTLFPLVVASVQSMTRRLDRYPKDFFDLIITDEVHRGAADGYVRIYDHFDRAKLIGLTATPFRSDGKDLMEVYDETCFDYGLEKAIDDGWLVPIVSETIPLEIDISMVGISKGEYVAGEAAEAIEPILGEVAMVLKEKAFDRKIVVFLPLVSTSKKFAQMLCDVGFDAEHVDGKSKDRKEILERFGTKGSGSAICNSVLLGEGWDEPSVDCVVILTPLRSTLRYVQFIGRGTRLCPETGKSNLYVPDFLWLAATHSLCHPSVLTAKTQEVADRMVELAKDSKFSGPKDIRELEEEAHESLVNDREAKLAERLKSFVGMKSKKFDPVLQCISLIDDTLVDWKPETKGEAKPVSDEQHAFLDRHGFDSSGWKSGYAERVIELVKQRSSDGLASPKQVRCLLRNGYANARTMTFEQATTAMDSLSKKWDAMSKRKRRKK